MTVSERDRRVMHDRLVDVLGEEVAGLVMEHLPPSGWGDVATKRDLDLHAAATKRDLDQFAAATKRDLDQVRADLDQLRIASKSDLDTAVQLLRAEMATGNATLAAELRTEMVRQTRAMIVTLVTTMIASLSTIAVVAR